MSKEYNVHIRSTVSYEFTVEVDADSEEEAMQIADDNYWQDDYHSEARASQMHDDFEVVSATEIVQEDDSMDDDDDFPGRE